ncbi:MAG: hypothetical protein AAF563_00270 [Pseudomonadota bacterium]
MPWARTGIALGVLFVLAVGPVNANEAEVSGEELRELLTGNSIDGMWGDTHYIQYFSDTGRTLYKADGSPGDWGTWRINDSGYYCSTWRGGAENCYTVVDMDGTLYWKSENGGATHPFTIIEGNVTEE